MSTVYFVYWKTFLIAVQKKILYMKLWSVNLSLVETFTVCNSLKYLKYWKIVCKLDIINKVWVSTLSVSFNIIEYNSLVIFEHFIKYYSIVIKNIYLIS